MIIFDDHNWQQSSDSPNSNYLEGEDSKRVKWVVDDNAPLACKIKSTPFWRAIEDESGQLTDIEPCEPPVTISDQIAAIKAELSALDMQAVRPLRAIAAGTATDEDRVKLAELETQAAKLREKLKQMEVDEWTTQ